MCEICNGILGFRHSRRGVLKALGAAGASIAAAGMVPGFASAQNLTSLPVGNLVQAASHAASWEAAISTGITESNGLKIQPMQYQAGANLLQALASGDIVAGVCGVAPTLLMRTRGVKVKILANSNREGSVLIVGQDINSPEDLNGKIVATPNIATPQEWLMRHFEEQNGIKTERAFVKITDMPVMLRNGEIAGYLVWEVAATVGLEVSGGKKFASSHDIIPNHECCSLIASESFLSERPEEAEKLVKSFVEGRKLITADNASLVDIVSKQDHVAPDLVKKSLENVKYSDILTDVPGLVKYVSDQLKYGVIEENRVDDVEAFVSESVDNTLAHKFI